MYRTFADVVTKADLDAQAKQAGERPLTPPIEGGKPYNDVVERSPVQAAYMDKIIRGMTTDGFVKISAIDGRDLVSRAKEIHHTTPTATAADRANRR